MCILGGDSDSDAENEKLLEFEEIIRTHEPSEFDEQTNPGETHQLHIGIERYRAPELIFKPYMAGSCEAGLSEVIAYVISLFDPENQLQLARNVVVTGGLANLVGLKQRLLVDLVSVRPFQSEVNINVVKNSSLSAWHGAREFVKRENYKDYLHTKTMYEEFGPEYFKVHIASNPYHPTPKETIIEVDV